MTRSRFPFVAVHHPARDVLRRWDQLVRELRERPAIVIVRSRRDRVPASATIRECSRFQAWLHAPRTRAPRDLRQSRACMHDSPAMVGPRPRGLTGHDAPACKRRSGPFPAFRKSLKINALRGALRMARSKRRAAAWGSLQAAGLIRLASVRGSPRPTRFGIMPGQPSAPSGGAIRKPRLEGFCDFS